MAKARGDTGLAGSEPDGSGLDVSGYAGSRLTGPAVRPSVGQACMADGPALGPAVFPTALRPRRRDRKSLLATTALQAVTVLVLTQPALAQLSPTARPTGGQVVGGQVGIAQSSQTTTVKQGSQYGAVNWQSYNVGSSHTVQYQQPNAQASTLNRVIGPDPSVIAGRITANGNVVLVNQSGVVFERGAQVDVHGLIVTSNNIRTQDFMAGRMNFDQPGNPNAQVVNHGSITVRESGLAALVAPSVANHGVINARMGKVVLAGATTHTIDLYGDGLIAVDVTGQVKQAPIGPDGKAVTTLVTNTGVIAADGGTVVLTAKAVDGIVSNLVTAGGRIQANTVGGTRGRIEIAGVGGGLTIEGDVAAMATVAGGKGGTVQALATGAVTVKTGARIDVSGSAGGGTVAIGTTLARAAGPAVKNAPMAARVAVEKGVTIAADATMDGNGGSIVLLAGGTTRMNGTLTARGGAWGGGGGFIEISGKTLASITGKVDVTAPHGKSGAILIDPDFLTIVADTSGNGDQDATFLGASGTIVAADPSVGADTLSNGVLNAFAGNVLLQANQTITVGANVSLTNTPTLILEAGGTITVNSGVVLTVSGNVFFGTGGASLSGTAPGAQSNPTIAVLGSIQSTGGGVTLAAGTGGVINIASSGSVQASTQAVLTAIAMDVAGTVVAPTVSLTATTGTLTLTGTVNASTAAVLAGEARIAGSTGRVIGGGTLTATSGGGAVDLSNSNNAVANASGSASSAFGLVDSTDLNLGTITAGTTVTVNAPTLTAADTITAPTVSLTATTGTLGVTSTVKASAAAVLAGQAGIAGSTGRVTGGGTLTATSGGGAVDLTNVNNAVANASGSASGVFDLVDSTDLNLGTITATTTVTVNAPTLTASGSITASTVSLTSTTGTLGVTGTIDASAAAVLAGQAGIAGSSGRVIGGGALTANSAAGAIDLTNANNVVASVTGVAATSFSFTDSAAVILGAITATNGNVFLNSTDTNGITFGASTTVTSVSGGRISLRADRLVNLGTVGATGAANAGAAGIVEVTPNITGVPVSLGSVIAGTLSLATLAGITAGVIRIGADAGPGGATTAGSIAVGGTGFDLATGVVTPATLVLNAIAAGGGTGNVGQSAPLLNVGTLAGGAASFTLSNTANAVANVSALTATAGATLVSGAALSLGTVTAGTIAVTAPTLVVPGTITAPTVSLIATTSTLILTGTVNASTAATLAGEAGVGGSTGRLLGGTLTANSALGDVILTGANNGITNVSGSVDVGAFTLTNAIALDVGTITAGTTVTVNAPTLTVSGLIVTPLATLTANGGTLTLGGTLDAATAVLSGQAGIAATVGRIIGDTTLTANSAAGAVVITNANNAIISATGTAATAFAVVSGVSLDLGNVSAGTTASANASTLTVSGSIDADVATLAATAGTLTLTGTVNAATSSALSGQAEIAGAVGRVIGGGSLSATSAGGSVDLSNSNNAVANASGSAAGAFVLVDSIDLNLGAVTAGTTAYASAPNLTASGSISADIASLVATTGTLSLTGTVNATTAAVLTGHAAIAGPSGRVIGEGSLSATSAAGAVDLGNSANAVAFATGSAATSFVLGDSGALNLGNVTAGTTAAITAGTMTVTAAVAAPTVTLTANTGTLGITGTVAATTSAALIGKGGIVVPTGIVTGDGALTATSASGSVDLSGTANAIASVAGAAAGSFTLQDTGTLVVGTLTAGTTITAGAPTITAAGALTAPTIAITAATGTLGITGTLTASTLATLSGNLGVIGPSGLILGNGALNPVSTAGSVDLTNAANQIASVYGSASGSYRISDLNALTVLSGKSVIANSVTLTTNQDLSNAGTITATGVGSAANPALDLVATLAGAFTNTGLVQATTGNARVSAFGQISSSGTMTAAASGNAGAPSFSLSSTTADIVQSGGTIAATDPNGFLALSASKGGISFAGTLLAGTPTTGGVSLSAANTITETVGGATTGVVATGTLTGASQAGAIALDNNMVSGNRIGTIAVLSALNGLSLTNARDLTLAGPVITTAGPLSIAVKAANGTAGNLTNTGTVAAGGTLLGGLTLTADGSIANAANAVITGAGPAASPSVALTSGTAITNAAGATIAATNTISGSVALTAGTDITSAGTIAASGSFAGVASVALTAGGTIAQTGGLISATHAAGSAALNAGSIDLAGTVNAGAGIGGAGGSVGLTSAGRITQGGGTNVGTGTGTIIAGLLTGASATTTTLDNIANRIGTIGPFTAAANLTLRNGAPTLTTAGTIAVSNNGTLLLQNGVTGGSNNLTLGSGSRLQAANVTLLAPGIISGPNAVIAATLLTLPSAATGAVGSGTGVSALRQAILGDPVAADPIPINAIGTLGPVTASESLVVMNTAPLLLAGDIVAPTIRIGATDGLTIASGVTVTTGGTILALPISSAVPPDTDATSGFNIALLASSGTIDLGPRLTIQGTSGTSQPIVRIAQTQGGQVVFGDLLAPSTNLILHVGTGGATSRAGTEIDVGNLFVFFRTGAPTVDLAGQVAGQTSSGAATVSRIGRETETSAFGQTLPSALQFDPSGLYQVNQCSITSVNCVLISTFQIPPLPAIQNLYIPLSADVLDDPDLLLPLISDQDE